MNQRDYDLLTEAQARPEEPTVSIEDIPDWTERTLLYGYGSIAGQASFHVFILAGLLHLHVYTPTGTVRRLSGTSLPAAELVPDKRVYPESTDAGFVRLLRASGVLVPLKNFDPDRYAKLQNVVFHGQL